MTIIEIILDDKYGFRVEAISFHTAGSIRNKSWPVLIIISISSRLHKFSACLTDSMDFVGLNMRRLSWRNIPVIVTLSYKTPLPKKLLQRVQANASSFKIQHLRLSFMSSSSYLRRLPHLPIDSIFPSSACFRRQFLRNVFPIQSAVLVHERCYRPPWPYVIIIFNTQVRSSKHFHWFSSYYVKTAHRWIQKE
jgi:hypothetical protein